MKYVIKYSVEDGEYHDASRALCELRAARRELKAARCAAKCA